jgi:single-stranded DNA-specific DHH superfamily exonuclease
LYPKIIGTGYADFLTKINDERKVLVAGIMKNLHKTLRNESRAEKSVIVVGDPDWRVGILGLVAGKIVDEYKKPAFVWGLEGGTVIKGSCRSDGTANLVEMMACLPEKSLIEFGGVKLRVYGNRFLRVVQDYAARFGIASKMQEKEIKIRRSAREEKPSDTKRETLVLFLQGKTVAEIATLRNLSETTVEGHVAYWLPLWIVLIDVLKGDLIEVFRSL